jgi:hypothetical protein
LEAALLTGPACHRAQRLGSFFTNTGDEFDLAGLVAAAGNRGSYIIPCPNGDCGPKTQAIFIPEASGTYLADLLNLVLIVPGGVIYQPGTGLNNARALPPPPPDWVIHPLDQETCHQQALQQEFGPGLGGFVSAFSLYNVSGNFAITAAAETARWGLWGLGIVLGKPALKAAGEIVAGVSAMATALATTIDARARHVCGQPVVP